MGPVTVRDYFFKKSTIPPAQQGVASKGSSGGGSSGWSGPAFPGSPVFADLGSATYVPSPVEQEAARRGAAYTLAFGAANGSPILSPDTGLFFAPKLNELSFNAPSNPGIEAYKRTVEFAARLSRVRASSQAKEYLSVGIRMPDLVFDAPVGAITVMLEPVFANKPQDVETTPIVINAAYVQAKPAPPYEKLGALFVNHSGQNFAGGSVALDPKAYQLDAASTYQATLYTFPDPPGTAPAQTALGSFSGSQTIHLFVPPIPSENLSFLLVEKT
jgi:hypothetical protein